MELLLTLAQNAAREAGRIAMSYYGSSAFTEKADASPVTETDTKLHEYLTQILSTSLIPILSEEGTEIDLTYPDKLWIIDPIDGTRGFINKTGDFAVMIGLLEAGRPALGVLLAPATDVMYFATKGGGAFKVQQGVTTPLRVSERHIPDLRSLQSRSHPAQYMHTVASALEVAESYSVGGIGIKSAMIAEDQADYFLTLAPLGEWDVCAPEIIVAEAGGLVTDRNGDPLLYGNPNHRIQNGTVFSNGACHREVLTALMLATR